MVGKPGWRAGAVLGAVVVVLGKVGTTGGAATGAPREQPAAAHAAPTAPATAAGRMPSMVKRGAAVPAQLRVLPQRHRRRYGRQPPWRRREALAPPAALVASRDWLTPDGKGPAKRVAELSPVSRCAQGREEVREE